MDYAESSAPLSAKGGYVGKFSRPAQGHADVCVRLDNGSWAALRYPDFSETGHILTHDQLSPGIGNGGACPASKKAETYGHYRIQPRPLPAAMHYCKTKGNCNPEETNGYTSYGDPAQQGKNAFP